ncbi:hypothetical protein CYMTET_45548 [Cymbomonas tetramitiformis]|uniref:Uncharacterized protein n=1 Tax=Cymbomonas tetramitiformis TaxID=36881 RepID=A0AAE0BZS6_9CHLO|nr:hypothetical protein CYMTET_45548 [Cymbomonas tetramitiformis]
MGVRVSTLGHERRGEIGLLVGAVGAAADAEEVSLLQQLDGHVADGAGGAHIFAEHWERRQARRRWDARGAEGLREAWGALRVGQR